MFKKNISGKVYCQYKNNLSAGKDCKCFVRTVEYSIHVSGDVCNVFVINFMLYFCRMIQMDSHGQHELYSLLHAQLTMK